jgi:formyltetrahydrofolate synthetase
MFKVQRFRTSLLRPPASDRLISFCQSFASGAGFIVVVAGNMMLMPGLPKSPQAIRMNVNEDGSITRLY